MIYVNYQPRDNFKMMLHPLFHLFPRNIELKKFSLEIHIKFKIDRRKFVFNLGHFQLHCSFPTTLPLLIGI